MFDAPAALARNVGGQVGGEVGDGRQSLGIGGVADRVARDLELVHRRAHHLVAKLRGGKEGQALLPRRVAVRRLQPSAARSERSEEHPSELQSLMRLSYAVLCLKTKN